MAYTKDDFLQAIRDTVTQFPNIAALYQAGDGRIIQAQAAMAQMLAMISQQQELAMAEPFDKVRDSTVLADASLKGIVPMAIPARVKVTVTNPTSTPFTLASGRVVLDSGGNTYRVDTPITVSASGVGDAEVLQEAPVIISHTVTASQPFYVIEVAQPTDGTFISGIAVQDASGNAFQYRQDFLNVGNGDKVFHVESDEYSRLFVKFGYAGVVGYQPGVGEVFTLTVNHTSGDVRPDANSPFSLEYAYTVQDSQITIKAKELLISGAEPISIATLRELCKYPSVYNSDAVYLGEFDFLIRRTMPNLQFLSIWNETLEESVRGASVDNINRLFVAVVPVDGADLEDTRAQIKRIILAADDSYDVLDVDTVDQTIGMTITAEVARIHDTDAVKQQIIDLIVASYGQSSAVTQAGMLVIQTKAVYKLLRDNIQALQDDGADYSVTIEAPPDVLLPEQYRYVTAESLTVTVTPADYNLGQWGR